MHTEEPNATSGRGGSYGSQGIELPWVTAVGFESLHLRVLHSDFELFAFS